MRRTPAAIPNANRDARMSFAAKQQLKAPLPLRNSFMTQ
jgi:hypothetical protein